MNQNLYFTGEEADELIRNLFKLHTEISGAGDLELLFIIYTYIRATVSGTHTI